MPSFTRPAGWVRSIDQQDDTLEFPLPELSEYSEEHIKDALQHTIEHLQNAIQFQNSGTTLSGALIAPGKENTTTIYALNCGDSTTQLRDENYRILKETRAHDFNNPEEIYRISSADPKSITFHPNNGSTKEKLGLTHTDTFGSLRLGSINMTRAAFGDKHNIDNTPVSDVLDIDLWHPPQDESTFLLAYTDGIESPTTLKIAEPVSIQREGNTPRFYFTPQERAENKEEEEGEIKRAYQAVLRKEKFNAMVLGALQQSGLNPNDMDHDAMQHACKALCDAAEKKGVTDDCAALISSVNLARPTLCLVLDGHGKHGHLVTRFAKYWFPRLLIQSLNREALDNPPRIDEEHADFYLANLPDHLRTRGARLLEKLSENKEYKRVQYQLEITLTELSFAEAGDQEYQDALKHFNDCWPNIMHHAKRPILFIESSLCWLPFLTTLIGSLVYHTNRYRFNNDILHSIEVALFGLVLAAVPYAIPSALSAYSHKFQTLFLPLRSDNQTHSEEPIPGTTILECDRKKKQTCLSHPTTKKIIVTTVLAVASVYLLTFLNHFNDDTIEAFSIVDSLAVSALLGYGLSAIWHQAVTCRDHYDTLRLERELQAFSRDATSRRTHFSNIKIEMAKRKKAVTENPDTPLLSSSYT